MDVQMGEPEHQPMPHSPPIIHIDDSDDDTAPAMAEAPEKPIDEPVTKDQVDEPVVEEQVEEPTVEEHMEEPAATDPVAKEPNEARPKEDPPHTATSGHSNPSR